MAHSEEYMAWRSLLVALLEEAGPVADGRRHCTGVDVVEVRGVGPFVFSVVDLELQVGRYEIGLDGRKIGCDYLLLVSANTRRLPYYLGHWPLLLPPACPESFVRGPATSLDMSSWVCIRVVNGPNAGSCSDIEHSLGICLW
jgi:hypothetical protein